MKNSKLFKSLTAILLAISLVSGEYAHSWALEESSGGGGVYTKS